MQCYRSFASRLIREPDVKLSLSRVTVLRMFRIMTALIEWVALIIVPNMMGADSGTPSSSISSAPLSADQVVDNLVRKNEERARALLHSEGTRVYRLAYRGIPRDSYAEMVVQATYDSPCSKQFKVVSESGRS